ncbi:MAG: hypothetical protein U1F36_11290 [Planctomycetota bacterium]
MNVAPRRRRSRGKRLAFAAVLLAVLYATIEAAAFAAYWVIDGKPFGFARVHDEQVRIAGEDTAAAAPTTDKYDARFDGAQHPFLGYVYDPTENYGVAKTTSFPVSDHGFRGERSPIVHRRPDRLIVGIVGGSVAESMSTRGDTALAETLQADPRLHGRRVEFVRLALGGYRQPQQLFALNWILAQGGELDVVVNLDGLNEVYGALTNHAQGTSIYYPQFWSRLVADQGSPAERRRIGAIELLGERRRGLARLFAAPPLRWSITAGLIWRILDRGVEIDRIERARESAPAGRLPYVATGVTEDLDRKGLITASVALWQRCSLQIHRLCRANGIRYLHFLQPNQYVPDSKELTAEERASAWLPDSLFHDVVVEAFPELRRAGGELTAQGVSFHDLTMVFAGLGESIYVDSCCHVNLHGDEILGRAIAAAILDDIARDPLPSPWSGSSDRHLVHLRSPVANYRLTQPLQAVTLEVDGEFDDGSTASLTFAGVSSRSSDPSCVDIDEDGRAVARAPGTATVVLTLGGQELRVPVTVAYAAITAYGTGRAVDGGTAPELTAVVRGDHAVVELTRAPGGAVASLMIGTAPDRTRVCRNEMLVEANGALTMTAPLEGRRGEKGTGHARFELPLGPELPPTIYLQAIIRGESDPCDLSTSNAIAITR